VVSLLPYDLTPFGVWLGLVTGKPPLAHSVLYLRQPTTTLPLKAFRREPAISWFDWHFTATHSSSAQFAT
jgi:hypothetical protein